MTIREIRNDRQLIFMGNLCARIGKETTIIVNVYLDPILNHWQEML